jgi:hypothetical protein
VHEFLHALGVYHEQSRSDRDTFVEIRWDNIQDGPPPDGEIDARGNFQKKPDATDYFDYDYGSLMHYPGTSFAKDPSKPTIVPRTTGVVIGQRTGMSFGDRQTIAKMYERFATRGYAGVWRAGTGRYALWANATWADFTARWEEWSGSGLRLVDLHVRQTQQGPRFSGVFLPGAGAHALWANVSWESFRTKWQEWSGQGLRLHDVHVHRANGENRWSGVFLPGNGGHGLWANVTWDSFVAKWQEWSSQGLRLHDLHVHEVDGQARYTGVFLPGNGGHALWANATWDSFVAKWQELSRQGLRLVDLNMHRTAGGDTRYSGAFLPGNDAHALWANVTFESFRAKWEELAGQGMRLVDFEFINPPSNMLLDTGDMADADPALEEDLEAFGGIFEATAPAGPDIDAEGGAEGGGGLRLATAGTDGADAESGGGAMTVDLQTSTTSSDTIDLGGIVLDTAEERAPAGQVTTSAPAPQQ